MVYLLGFQMNSGYLYLICQCQWHWLALEECPIEEDLTILTDSLSSMDLLQSMQRGDFPVSLYRHSVRHPLLHVVTLLNRRAAAGSITRASSKCGHIGVNP